MRWIVLTLLFYTGIAHAQVVISEVLWAGSEVSTADEWIELYSVQGLSLSGWTLTRLKDGVEIEMIRFKSDDSIGAGKFYLVSNYDEPGSALSITPNKVTTDVSLSNTKLLLRLRDQEGNLIDSVDDGVGVPFAGDNPTGAGGEASMERIDLTQSGGLKSNWKTATTSINIDSGSLTLGTPGIRYSGSGSSSSSSSSYSSTSSTSSSSSSTSNTSTTSSSSLTSNEEPLYKPKVYITEVLPNPIGKDSDHEWIEIGSSESGSINISGWTLDTGGSKSFEIPLDTRIESGAYLLYKRPQSKLSLSNAGGEVRLLSGSVVIDTWEYPEMPEEISFGRDRETNKLQFFCIPSPGEVNTSDNLHPTIDIQSGGKSGVGSVTINIQARVDEGSLDSAQCTFTYSDGFTSDSCNPPSHTFRSIGNHTVTLDVATYCGNTVQQSLNISVLPKGVYESPLYSSLIAPDESCTPKTQTGVVILSFLPNPEGKDTEGEWIEIYNESLETASLCGWVLDDGIDGSSPFTLDKYELKAGETLRLSRSETKIALNNDGDSVRLLYGEEIKDKVTYESAKEGRIYPYIDSFVEEDLPENPQMYNSEIFINEIYPSPLTGEQEWIELFNPSLSGANLSGWIIDDIHEGGSKPWTIPQGITISSGGYLVFYQSALGLRLNNTGDEVWLITPDNTVIDSITYDKIKKGTSYSRVIRDRFCITENITPLRENNCQIILSPFGGELERGELKEKTSKKHLHEGLNSKSSIQKVNNEKTLPSPMGRGLGRGGIKFSSIIRTKYKNVRPENDDINHNHVMLSGVEAQHDDIFSQLQAHVVSDISEIQKQKTTPLTDIIAVVMSLCSVFGLWCVQRCVST